MKKYVINKNLDHSGTVYSKGQEVSEKDAGFKELLSIGHVDVLEGKQESKVEAPVEVSSEEKFLKKKK